MPIRRKYRKKNTRRRPVRRAARRQPNRRNVNRVPPGSAPVARRHIVRMKYSDVLDWSVTTLATSVQQYRLNSTFDPDVTGTGHQPYGRDQLAALFDHYRVFKCSWHIEFAPSNDRLHVSVVPLNTTAVPGSLTDAGEMPLAVTKAMAFNGGVPCRFSGQIWLPRLAGRTSAQYKSDDLYAAASGANPAEAMFLNILVYNPSPQTVDTSMTITLNYWTEWYDPVVLGPS